MHSYQAGCNKPRADVKYVISPIAPEPCSLEVRLLGPFKLAVDGLPVEEHQWPRPKPKLLIKLLALQPHHRLHREQIMELLWPELEPESAVNNLRKTVHLARRALEPALVSAAASHFLITQNQQIILRAPRELRVDVDAFERRAADAFRHDDTALYEAALALYEGDLLTEDLYEDWAAARRESLRGTRQNLLSGLARLYEARGRYAESIEQLEALVRLDPSHEETHRELMRLYALAGRRQRALQQYRHCREALRQELDAEPEPETAALHQRIAAGQIQPLPPPAPRNDQDRHRAVGSLAVLPLANASADSRVAYLSDGITENIINRLAQLPGLRVLARSTVFRYKNREIDPQVVGRELGVRAVLTGRVVELHGELVVNAELVDTTDGSQMWGQQYSRECSDFFAVQEEISREVAGKLRRRLNTEERRRVGLQQKAEGSRQVGVAGRQKAESRRQ